MEFNPARVSEYRLIGYETRMLNREDFNNDKIDAGDVGSGHTVTALYEITPVGSKGQMIDDLRYQKAEAAPARPEKESGEYGFLKIRYKLPNSDTSKLISQPITDRQEVDTIQKAPDDARFATAVAGFAELLRGDPYVRSYSYDDVIALADSARGKDTFGYRAEFMNLVRLAKSASGSVVTTPVPAQE